MNTVAEPTIDRARGAGAWIRRGWRTATLVLLILFPPAIAYGIIYRHAFFFPYQDDYNAIVAFAVDDQRIPTLGAKALAIVSSEHTEYKLVLEHSLIALELAVTGHLSFTFLVALGNLSLIPIAWILWRIHCQEEKSSPDTLLAFLPISLIFFSLSYWETLNWATAAIQNLWVVLFAALSLYLLMPNRTGNHSGLRLSAACVSSVCSAFSLANGFLLAPVGLVLLLRRKAYVASVIWCASFAVAAGVYAYHYHILPEKQPTNLTRGIYFFCFLGCALENRTAAFILGLLLTALFALSIRRRFDRTHPVTFYLTLWIFCTAALVAWVRGSTSSRYSIYSVLLFIFAFRFLAHYVALRFPRLRFAHVLAASIVLSLLLCVSADISASRNLRKRREMVLSGINIYLASSGSRSPMIDPLVKITWPKEEEFERVTLTRAIHDGILKRPGLQDVK